jgi:hypothetical protein
MTSDADDRTFSYQIDGQDRIVAWNDAFLSFADENNGSALSSKALLDQPLWKFISDQETRLLYKVILRRVRDGKPMQLNLRCDSPSCRRHIKLHIEQLPNHQVRFESQIVRQESRDYVALLDTSIQREPSIVSVCSWCKKVQVPGRGWFEVEDALDLLNLRDVATLPQIAHIVCFDCYRNIVNKR